MLVGEDEEYVQNIITKKCESCGCVFVTVRTNDRKICSDCESELYKPQK